jgi:protease IV
VTALFLVLDNVAGTSADFSELRALVERYKRSGKPFYAHVEPADWHSLMVAAAAERITTGPAGAVMVHGLGLELPFLKGFLDRYGVSVQSSQRSEYKGVMEPLTRSQPSAPLAESMQSLIDSSFDQAALALAARPGWDFTRAAHALENGPYTLAQAVERGLIDEVAERDEAEDFVRTASGVPTGRPRRFHRVPQGVPQRRALPDLARLGLTPPRPLSLKRRPKLAFVPVNGIIVDRAIGWAGRRRVAVAAQLAPLIRALADSRSVSALVLAIDSRGGTTTGSERIWSAVRYAAARKPVVAWMRNYAASGGYYVAAPARTIIASPFTITGSIGVAMSKPNVGEAATQLGINPVAFVRGGGTGLSSPFRPLSDHELSWLEASLDEAYSRFKTVVSEGRGMTLERVEEVARGRVWTGPQAHELGLVDSVGHYPDVLDACRRLLGLADEVEPDVVWTVPPEGPLQFVRRLFGTPAQFFGPFLEPLHEQMVVTTLSPVLYYLPYTVSSRSYFAGQAGEE